MAEQVLLNAVRASHDLPMSFTKLQKYTAAGMMSASLAPKFPFGPDAVNSNDLGPTVNWNPGVFQIEYADVNTAGGLAKLNQTLQFAEIHRYIDEGIPAPVALTIFIQYVEIHEELIDALSKQATTACRVPAKESKAVCDELAKIYRECNNGAWFHQPPVTLEHLQKFYVIQNHAQTRCGFLQFQYLPLLFHLAKLGSDLIPQTSYETAETPEKKLVRVAKRTSEAGMRFQDKDVEAVKKRIDDRFKGFKDMKHRSSLKFGLRSPRGVLSYLGQLIALQNFASEPYEPELLLGAQHTTLFRVNRGISSIGSAAIAVTDEYGERFFVPRPEYGSPTRDQTLRVVAITAEVVNGAISEKDFPPPSTVVVRPIQ